MDVLRSHGTRGKVLKTKLRLKGHNTIVLDSLMINGDYKWAIKIILWWCRQNATKRIIKGNSTCEWMKRWKLSAVLSELILLLQFCWYKCEMQFFDGRNYKINKILLSCVGQWPYQTNRSSNAIIIIIVSLAGTQFIAKVWWRIFKYRKLKELYSETHIIKCSIR